MIMKKKLKKDLEKLIKEENKEEINIFKVLLPRYKDTIEENNFKNGNFLVIKNED